MASQTTQLVVNQNRSREIRSKAIRTNHSCNLRRRIDSIIFHKDKRFTHYRAVICRLLDGQRRAEFRGSLRSRGRLLDRL